LTERRIAISYDPQKPLTLFFYAKLILNQYLKKYVALFYEASTTTESHSRGIVCRPYYYSVCKGKIRL